ncbi:sigma-70 family RNA polymerase sigma factor [Neolewinella aurantiaca]|uniref:Sigma-70 family RNA polymerase sigma factor n=1 Tax=Neolewinella aurantiaca TaxID=2602767 RepID=A0A5C7FED9_9BACT|nr:sigma-70 family RNA polymerase sigma factor [Neolewinella aurantiaca]TXF89121.1 sigma-70 family RNA polymerase sigma factor [Neolewinella aurantiaca]
MTDKNPKYEWDEAYREYDTELAAFVRDRIPADEAADLLQEVWASYLTALHNSSINQPRAWLYRVTRNRITDYYRRRSGRPAFQDLTEDIDAETDEQYSEADPDDVWADIEDALDLLPPNQREVFVRNELDGETLREIAVDLGVPLKTIISRKGYARTRLRSLLQTTYDNYFGYD